MIDYTNRNKATVEPRTAQTRAVTFDEGSRKYMLKVYDFMVIGLGITGLVSYMVAQSPALIKAIYGTPLLWVVIFAPLVFVFIFGAKIGKMSSRAAKISFFVFSGLMGLSMSSLFLAYTGTSIAKAFFITAALFGSMSLYGYTTKKDLTSIGSFLIMGVWGVIIASLVNLFFMSSGMSFAINLIVVVLFTGLTAYDTQKIKQLYYIGGGDSRVAILGALNLYLDVINLFQAILYFVGDRR